MTSTCIYIYIYIYVNFNINIEQKFIFLSNCDGAPLGVGALRKLRTLLIGSGSTGFSSAIDETFLVPKEHFCEQFLKEPLCMCVCVSVLCVCVCVVCGVVVWRTFSTIKKRLCSVKVPWMLKVIHGSMIIYVDRLWFYISQVWLYISQIWLNILHRDFISRNLDFISHIVIWPHNCDFKSHKCYIISHRCYLISHKCDFISLQLQLYNHKPDFTSYIVTCYLTIGTVP